ncbi:Plasmodium exported protein (Pm-fam-a like), unknown function [Plasmodium malariae]|uniref:Fam-l protein n=2 Tax=Plasmodium (Plasmodium) TaxID=418103 RepID=A0A1A8X188_PLAMA|nr:Plasmodium exported protein (Pm-fam-a like), unknown function [Plasmodium malariae]
MSKFNNIFDDKYGICRKLYRKIYRLLGDCEKDTYSNVRNLKKCNDKLFTVSNEKRDKEKSAKLYRSLLYKEKLFKRLMKNKITMLHKSYSHYEKKIMNGLDDICFFKKIMLINDKDYKKLKRKKYILMLFLLLISFVMVLTIPILDLSIGNLLMKIFTLLDNGTSANLGAVGSPSPTASPNTSWIEYFSKNFSVLYKAESILIYCIPILVLAIILILGIFCYYKHVIKQKKIKSLEMFNEW